MPITRLLSVMLLYLVSSLAFGEEPPPLTPVITDVYRLGSKLTDKLTNEEKQARRTAGINDTLVVKIGNFQTLVKQARCLPPFESNCKPQGIDLYLDGKKVAERDSAEALGRELDTIEFDLKYDVDEHDTRLKNNWAKLLSITEVSSGEFFERPVELAVGLDDANINTMLELKDDKNPFRLKRVDMTKFWICIALLALLIIVIFSFSAAKKKLREALSDIGPPPATGFKQWSLARCQMAFWFVLIVVSFLSIWVVTGALDTINDTVLALIGIGAGTALGSAAIDVSSDIQDKLDELRKKADVINTELLEIDAKMAAAAGNPAQETFLQSLKSVTQDRLSTINEQMLKKSKIALSTGFWNDILNDQEGGASFHRIQMVVWTLILGNIFVYSVWDTLSMPTFDNTMLALQGLSAGTYLGFKIPDKK